jgi:hypothetical protein
MGAAATPVRDYNDLQKNLAAAAIANELHQMADGSAAYMKGLNAGSSGDTRRFESRGQVVIPKTANIYFLDGGRVYWDRSAGAGHYKKVNDRDFYAGRAVGDAAAADTTMTINLNIDPPYDIDALRHGFLSVPTGTQAVGAFGYPKDLGDSKLLELTATNEAQCIDLLSVDRFALGANAIVEGIIRIPVNGSGAAVDFSLGVANGTSTTDADAITESVFFHIDGGALDIYAESDDGTTEVNATDTTVDATAGSAVTNRFEFWIDMRDPSDCILYINAVEVLHATANLGNIALATGPFGLLAHLEKTAGTTTAQVIIDALRARYSE